MSEDVKARCNENNIAAVQRWAAENNLDVVFPEENQLFIDIDDYRSMEEFSRNRDIIHEVYGIVETRVSDSRSGYPKRHLVVVLNKKITSVMERLALQAILGSDRRREANSLRRYILDGELTPTLFFEVKE
jgi:broad-specificity NMP kinase